MKRKLFIVLLSVLMIVAAIAVFYLINNSNDDNFDRIKLGMTQKEVENIIGTNTYGVYETKEAEIEIRYNENGLVTAKSYITKNTSEESVIVGKLSLVTKNNLAQNITSMTGLMINNYIIKLNKQTKYRSFTKDSPFDLIMGKYYKVIGRVDGNMFLVKRIEKLD